jgi:hypothetical protein
MSRVKPAFAVSWSGSPSSDAAPTSNDPIIRLSIAGHTELTRIPIDAPSSAATFVKPTTACFVAV